MAKAPEDMGSYIDGSGRGGTSYSHCKEAMDRRNGPVLLQRLIRPNETGPLESAAIDDQGTKGNTVPSDRPAADMDAAAAG